MTIIGPMARVQVIVQLSDELVAALDVEAAARRTSRSALIRQAVDDLLGVSRDAALVRQVVEGYKRIPPGGRDEWGDLETFGDAATGDMLRRLAAEEAAAGLPPW